MKNSMCRSVKGQGLAEGVAGLVIFCTIFVGCLMLFINTVVLSDYYRKLQIAATEAAKSIDAQKYWLGALRPDYNQAAAEQNARNLADFILVSFGLPKTSSFNVDYPQQPSNLAGQPATVLTRVTLSVNQLRTVGGLFAPFIELKGSGISTSSGAGQGNYAMATMCFKYAYDPSGFGRIIQFPIYAAYGGDGGGRTYPVVQPCPMTMPVQNAGFLIFSGEPYGGGTTPYEPGVTSLPSGQWSYWGH